MNNINFITGSRELLDLVQPMWERLNSHHENKSAYFSDHFKNLTFNVRKNKFMNDKSLEVKVDIIIDKDKEEYIGYCISTVSSELMGEIESIFIEKEYRKYGLGDKLMTSALVWLDSKNVIRKRIGVAEGNEDVLQFYRRYGFYKRSIILEQVREYD